MNFGVCFLSPCWGGRGSFVFLAVVIQTLNAV